MKSVLLALVFCLVCSSVAFGQCYYYVPAPVYSCPTYYSTTPLYSYDGGYVYSYPAYSYPTYIYSYPIYSYPVYSPRVRVVYPRTYYVW